jgi:FAD synthetase
MVVYTPSIHRRETICRGMQILTPLPEKRRRLDMLGVDHAVVAHFDTSYATRSVRTFLDEIATLNPIEIWEEPNFRFGSDREGNPDALRACFEVRVLDPICCSAGKIISCSRVRTLISRNKPDEVLGAAGVVGRHRADPKTVRPDHRVREARITADAVPISRSRRSQDRPSHFGTRLLFRPRCLSHKPQAPSLPRSAPDFAHFRTSFLTATWCGCTFIVHIVLYS